MKVVKISFHLRLETSILAGLPGIVGPLFHRFVPNGKNDAIFLTPDDDPHQIQIWFDRAAKLENGFLVWEKNGSQFDEDVMRRQAKLVGGPLCGQFLMPDVSSVEMASLLRNPKTLDEPFGQDAGDDAAYVSLGKRVLRYCGHA